MTEIKTTLLSLCDINREFIFLKDIFTFELIINKVCASVGLLPVPRKSNKHFKETSEGMACDCKDVKSSSDLT